MSCISIMPQNVIRIERSLKLLFDLLLIHSMNTINLRNREPKYLFFETERLNKNILYTLFIVDTLT